MFYATRPLGLLVISKILEIKFKKNSNSLMKRKIKEHITDLFETYDIDEIH